MGVIKHAWSGLARAVQPLLRSKRVWVALAAVLVGWLTLLVPTLEPVHDELVVLIVTVALVVIGGFSIDEATRLAKERGDEAEEHLRQQIKGLLAELFEEMMVERKEPPHEREGR